MARTKDLFSLDQRMRLQEIRATYGLCSLLVFCTRVTSILDGLDQALSYLRTLRFELVQLKSKRVRMIDSDIKFLSDLSHDLSR